MKPIDWAFFAAMVAVVILGLAESSQHRRMADERLRQADAVLARAERVATQSRDEIAKARADVAVCQQRADDYLKALQTVVKVNRR